MDLLADCLILTTHPERKTFVMQALERMSKTAKDAVATIRRGNGLPCVAFREPIY